mgnify:CR=1 FL=1|jgi:hypothetical protein
MNIILIPIFNDWKSLNYLLNQINKSIDQNTPTKILIIDDCSTQKINIDKKNFPRIEEIKVLTLNQNLGSQKSIAIGLDYLKKLNNNFYVTIMDGDGEDNPSKINKMLNMAKQNNTHIITSHRKKRNENFIIKFGYKIHLTLCLLTTWNWISFGNFSCFHSSNLEKILVNNNIWFAYSAGVLKNCKIIKLYSTRQKRYFESSKVNILKLIEHSIRIASVFYSKVLLSSLIYLFIIYSFFGKLKIFFYFLIFAFNFLILFIKIKNYSSDPINYLLYTKDIKTI